MKHIVLLALSYLFYFILFDLLILFYLFDIIINM